MLRKFISYHGLIVLKNCLAAHMDSKTICRHQVLVVLKMLPIGTRNAIVKLEEMVLKMVDADIYGNDTAVVAKDLIETWSTLELVYKIPKRTSSALDTSMDNETESRRTSISSPSKKSDSRSNEQSSKRYRMDDDKYRRGDSNSRRSYTPDIRMSHSSSHDWRRSLPDVKLPAGWQKCFEDGRIIYRHAQTNQFSWEPPVEVAPPPVPPVPAGPIPFLPGISQDQLKEIVEAAQEAGRKQKELEEKLESDKVKKEKMRAEKRKVEIQKIKAEAEKMKADRREAKQLKEQKKSEVPTVEKADYANDKASAPAVDDFVSSWTSAQVKTTKSQVTLCLSLSSLKL